MWIESEKFVPKPHTLCLLMHFLLSDLRWGVFFEVPLTFQQLYQTVGVMSCVCVCVCHSTCVCLTMIRISYSYLFAEQNNINCKILRRFFVECVCHCQCRLYAAVDIDEWPFKWNMDFFFYFACFLIFVKEVYRLYLYDEDGNSDDDVRRRTTNRWMNGKQLNSLNHFPCINIYCFLVMFI